jgi:hypothetical protein
VSVSTASLLPPAQESATEHLTANHLSVNTVTVAMFAIVIAYVDGFCITSLHGAIGAVRTSQDPFWRWLRDSTMLLPVLALAVLCALVLTRRWVGRSRRELVRLAAAALLIVVITSAVSIAEVATNAVADYTTQTSEIGVLNHAGHFGAPVTAASTVGPDNTTTCTAACAARHLTVMADVRAVGEASVVLLITNLVLVVWVLALRGGRLFGGR